MQGELGKDRSDDPTNHIAAGSGFVIDLDRSPKSLVALFLA